MAAVDDFTVRVNAVQGKSKSHTEVDMSGCLGRCLVVEDDIGFASSLMEELTDLRIESDHAKDIATAQRLVNENRYDAIIADSRIDHGGGGPRGEDWLASVKGASDGVFAAVLTAYSGDLNPQQLGRRHGIRVYSKGTAASEEEELFKRLSIFMRARCEDLQSRLKSALGAHFARGPEGMLMHLELADRAAEAFRKYLETQLQSSAPIVSYGGRAYAVDDLMVEVANGSRLGYEFVGMFMNGIESLCDLSNEPNGAA